jgi:hypothetical protein
VDTQSCAQPISRWALKDLLVDTISISARGVTSIAKIVTGIAEFAHHLRDAPRKRKPQDPQSCPLFQAWRAAGPPIAT